MILATRYGFHGKKGLAGAVTGSERDQDRDPRVRFIRFPMDECRDLSLRDAPFDPAPYRAELDALAAEHRPASACLITEPYLGGGGSYHPPQAYLQLLQDFCREHDIVFILDEVQANFGRTGELFAFETYGLEPDIVVLGKGLGNGVPVACAAGARDVFGALDYGEAPTPGAPTRSAAPPCWRRSTSSRPDVLGGRAQVVGDHRRRAGRAEGAAVRRPRARRKGRHGLGRRGDGVRGEDRERDGERLRAGGYRGDDKGRAVHLMGPLAKNVLRIAPPLTITEAEARDSVAALAACFANLRSQLSETSVTASSQVR